MYYNFQAKGMQDPEIQNILTDPVMRQVKSIYLLFVLTKRWFPQSVYLHLSSFVLNRCSLISKRTQKQLKNILRILL